MLAVMALLLAGCAQDAETDRAFTEPPPCNPEPGRPITEATLKAVFARHGIRLYRDDSCEIFRNPNAPPPEADGPPRNPDAPQAMLQNCSDAIDCDPVFSAQGHIFCDVYREEPIGDKQRRGTNVTRIKYEGDTETHLRIFNVDCAIYPDSPEQIDALAVAIREALRASG
jgi:hypothetical protein